jgi:hypothetical protein
MRQPEWSVHAVLQLHELAPRGNAAAGHLGALPGQEVLMIHGQPLGAGDRLQILRCLALVAALAIAASAPDRSHPALPRISIGGQ